MAPHCKELSEDLRKRIVALYNDGIGYKKIAITLKLSCSMVAKSIQRFKRPCSTHIHRLSLVNRRRSAASIAAEVGGEGGDMEVLIIIQPMMYSIRFFYISGQ